jgi:hypothetical protein
MSAELPAIAFDRFIRLDWISEALKVRSGQITSEQLEQYLDSAGLGNEARKKTHTKLKVLCLEPRSELKDFMERGVKTAIPAFSLQDIMPFAWGAIITNYPFFARVAELVGRLSSIQGDCAAAEVHRRMSEVYGERHNVKVATRAAIQTLVDWAVVRREDGDNRLIPTERLTLSDSQKILWLVEALVRQAGKPLPLESLQSSPLAFPFSFDASLPYLASHSEFLELRMAGANQQFIAVRS